MSAPYSVAMAVLMIDANLTELKKEIAGSNVNINRVMELATEIRAEAGIIRDYGIRDSTN